MTVTFAPESGPTVAFALTDVTGGRSAELYATEREAIDAMYAFRATDKVLPGCTDPDEVQWNRDYIVASALSGDDLSGEVAPTIRLANAEARRVLDLLGYSDPETGECEDTCGSCPAEAFLARVETARVLAPYDSGDRSVAHGAGGGMAVVECDRPRGHMQRTLHNLRDIALWAAEQERIVSWG